MANEIDRTKLFAQLDGLLADTDISEVTSESSGFESVPDGYYLSEVKKAELTESKTSHNPMVSFQFTICEDGTSIDDDGDTKINKGTKNRTLFVHFPLKDERSVKRFVTDMLKFEGETPGEPLLGKEYFTNSELLIDALDVLIGMRIYVQVSTTEKDGQKSTWNNLISWKRAAALELPE